MENRKCFAVSNDINITFTGQVFVQNTFLKKYTLYLK